MRVALHSQATKDMTKRLLSNGLATPRSAAHRAVLLVAPSSRSGITIMIGEDCMADLHSLPSCPCSIGGTVASTHLTRRKAGIATAVVSPTTPQLNFLHGDKTAAARLARESFPYRTGRDHVN